MRAPVPERWRKGRRQKRKKKQFGRLAFLSILPMSLSESMHSIAMRGDVELLKQRMADDPRAVNELDEGRSTPLFAAAFSGQHAAVEALLQAGAHVNIVNENGQTALMAARQGANDEGVIDCLIGMGAIELGSGTTDGLPLTLFTTSHEDIRFLSVRPKVGLAESTETLDDAGDEPSMPQSSTTPPTTPDKESASAGEGGGRKILGLLKSLSRGGLSEGLIPTFTSSDEGESAPPPISQLVAMELKMISPIPQLRVRHFYSLLLHFGSRLVFVGGPRDVRAAAGPQGLW